MDITKFADIDQEPRVQLSTMETSSPVKRKAAAIDLTRSDSEDEAPKRRVIEIESDDDDEQPWERPEWKAKCEAERNDDVVKTVAALARASFGFTIADACDDGNGAPSRPNYTLFSGVDRLLEGSRGRSGVG